MQVMLRGGRPEDASAIAALVDAEGQRTRGVASIARLVERFPSRVAELGGALVGFALCAPFAPDVLELRHLLVRTDHRRRGLGSALLSELEAELPRTFTWLIVVTSELYAGRDQTGRGSTLYTRSGYLVVLDTGPTRVLAKRLSATRRRGGADGRRGIS